MSSDVVSVPGRTRGLIAVGDGLPRMSFPRVGGSGRVSWNQGTMASVVFLAHPGRCEECARYARALGATVAGLAEWATRALIMVGSDGEAVASAAAAGGPGVLVLVDAGGAGRAQLGVGKDRAAVVQADRWGAVYEVEAVGLADGSHGRLPGPEQLVSLAQFIDIQCPECEVPSKEWLDVSPFPLG